MKVDRRRWTEEGREGNIVRNMKATTVLKLWTRNREKVQVRKGKRRFAFLDFCELLRLVRWGGGGLDFSQSN
jgi:hypothetical protein